jgi:hypothetical protein
VQLVVAGKEEGLAGDAYFCCCIRSSADVGPCCSELISTSMHQPRVVDRDANKYFNLYFPSFKPVIY